MVTPPAAWAGTRQVEWAGPQRRRPTAALDKNKTVNDRCIMESRTRRGGNRRLELVIAKLVVEDRHCILQILRAPHLAHHFTCGQEHLQGGLVKRIRSGLRVHDLHQKERDGDGDDSDQQQRQQQVHGWRELFGLQADSDS